MKNNNFFFYAPFSVYILDDQIFPMMQQSCNRGCEFAGVSEPKVRWSMINRSTYFMIPSIRKLIWAELLMQCNKKTKNQGYSACERTINTHQVDFKPGQ